MRLQAFVKTLTLLILTILGASSCATRGDVREQAIDHTLEMCRLLSEPGIETKAGGEIWFSYQTERVNTSRQLWNPEGIKAIEARLARTEASANQACLRRALREARNREAE